ncbi:10148_t:CDS:2, partial [Scutellospora calospora]
NNTRVVFSASVAVRKDNFETIISDYLTFVDKSMLIKEFIESLDFDKIIEKLKLLIAEIYREHYYLIKNLYPDELRKYQSFLNEDSTESQLEFSLKMLSKYLRQHYKKKYIVLIDEYDFLMECAYNKRYYESNDENIAKAMLVENHKDSSSLYVDKFGFTSDEMINVPFFTKGQTITSILNNLLHGNLDLFSKEFENMIVDTLSFYEVRGSNSGKNVEYVYYAFCLGVFTNVCDRGFIVYSNCEAGFRRYNVKIIPKLGVNEIAIIIEFKVVLDKKSLYDMTQEGLLQIEE